MADTWWRFYNTAPDHPKVLALNDAQFRAWAVINSLASKLGGKIPEDISLIAKALRKGTGKTRDLIQVLLSVKLLDQTEDGYRPHNWDTKQFKSDTSTERVKRFRDKQCNGVSETDQRQSQRHRQKEKTRAAPLGRFDEFWLVCPKKTGRGAAEKAWLKAVPLADEQTLIDAMRAYAGTCVGKEKTYVKTPGPWLNEKRWLDEGIAPVAPLQTPEELAEILDRRDRLLRQGKYAPELPMTDAQDQLQTAARTHLQAFQEACREKRSHDATREMRLHRAALEAARAIATYEHQMGLK